MSAPAALPAGATVAGYTIEGVLGRGGMGTVYRARGREHREPVALKLVAAHSRWLEREARLAAAVSHRAILPVYESGEHDGQPFVAMKLEPLDLGALLREEGRLSTPRALALLSQVASALDAAHAHGLVHRDIKPSNILLGEEDGDERAYVADFGVARATFSDGSLAAGEIVGTVAYASPEQIRGEPVDHRTDVYALGCVLYECLTGRVPYARRDSLATLWAHLHDEPPRPSALVPSLHPGLDDVVQRALAKGPEARFSSAGALAEAAREAVEGRSTHISPLGTVGSSNLPTTGMSFVGREQELEEAAVLLRQTHLLSINGPGGAGKTRFALELVRRAQAGHEHEAFACFLASLRDPTLVLATIAQSLSVPERPGESALEALSTRIGESRILLLVDNAEHLLSAKSELGQLLDSCPGLTLVVTSRERLHLAGELAYDLPPLALDEGVALFCDRAATDPTEAIRELCSRLEGLPLAIELAAARMTLLSPEQLLARLSERLDLLQGSRDADPRQQTLRATIEWSYDLLSTDAQQLLGRLSVFAGGCTLEAAEAVCGADLDSLESLFEKSMLRRSATRFTMLETIHEYAAGLLERAGETEDLRGRHAEYFATLAERVAGTVRGTHLELLDEVTRDYANFRAALQWTQASESRLFVQLVGALAMFWNTRGPYAEARRWLESAYRLEAGDDRLGARVARGLGALSAQQGDFAAAKPAHERALGLARRAGDRQLECSSLGNLAVSAWRLGDISSARLRLGECEELARDLGDELALARVTHTVGVFELSHGTLAAAERAAAESLAAAERLGEPGLAAQAIANLALVALRDARTEEAARRYRESFRAAERIQLPQTQAASSVGLAAVASRVGDPVRGARLLGVAAATLERVGGVLEPMYKALEEETRAAVWDRLGADAAEEAFTAGTTLEPAEAMAYALEEPTPSANAQA